MATWEYCQLRLRTDVGVRTFYQVTYFSAGLNEDIKNGVLLHRFLRWETALSYLGELGWEAFYIDAEGQWFFKRPDDWEADQIWDEDEDEEDEDEEVDDEDDDDEDDDDEEDDLVWAPT